MASPSKNYVMVDEDTIEAAAFGLRGVETGRRVGWAKAFDAMRRADSAERDINMIRGDIRVLAAFGGRALGALYEFLGGDTVDRLFRGDHHELKGFFPDGPYNAGRYAARDYVAGRETLLGRLRQEIKDLRAERVEVVDKIFLGAQHKTLAGLARQFGFANPEVMLEWLSKSPGHDCAALGCYKIPRRCSYHFTADGSLIQVGGQ